MTSPSHNTSDENPTNSQDTASRIIAGQYETLKLISNRQGATYFEARDSSTDQLVSLKLIPVAMLTDAVRMRLEYESSILDGMKSPYLAKRLGFGWHEEEYFIASDLASHSTLESRLQAGPLEVAETIDVARAVLSGLRDLHESNILHRNLRPENIVLKQDGGSHGMLTDYGLSLTVDPNTPLKLQPLEVAKYTSPEQAGSIDCSMSCSSDLYSLGVILFSCVTGTPPFDGKSVGDLLFKHLTNPIPDISSESRHVPLALDSFVQRLLRKDPRDRYQTAAAALADLEAIDEHLKSSDTEESIVLGSRDRRHTLIEPAFVGRSSQLQTLKRAMSNVTGGKKTLITIEGESGSGKSRLLAETLRHATKDGFRVYRGYGANEVSSTPFRLLDGIVEGVIQDAASDPNFKQTLTELLGDRKLTIVSALPALKTVLGIDEDFAAPEETGEARTLEALVQFVEILGRLDKPLLILLDDCQWADELTVKLLRRLSSSSTDPSALLLAITFRSEEIPEDHLLRAIDVIASVTLTPLNDQEIGQLAFSMAGNLPERAVSTIVRLAGGSPFMASAVLHGLVECKALVPVDSGWEVDEDELSDAGSSTQVGSFLARRLELLPKQSLYFLSVGAILGKQFDLYAAQQLADFSASELIESLEDVKGRHLVWLRPDGSKCVFFHDKIRASLLDYLDPEQKAELHLAAARYFLDKHPDQVGDIAYHFDAGQDSESALPYATEAAEQARSQYALEIAEQQYEIALRGASSDAERLTIMEGLGDVHMLRGRYREADKWFESAAPLAAAGYPQANIRCKIGELYFKRGEMASAIRNFEAALRLQGQFVPSRQSVALIVMLWETFVQVLHSCFPKMFLHRTLRTPNDSERLSMRLLSYFAHGCWYSRRQIPMLWSHLRNINMAERFLPSNELAQAYAEHGPGMAVLGYFSRAVRYAERSIRMREELQDTWGRGQSLVFQGITLFSASRYRECIESCRTAIRILEKIGDYWQIHMARYQVAASLYYLGDLEGAIEESKTNHKSGLETGDLQASGIILDVWARASRGQVPQDYLKLEIERKRTDAQGTSQVLLAKGVCLLSEGNGHDAVAAFEDATGVAAKAGVKNAYTITPYAWTATALRETAEVTGSVTPFQRALLLNKAERIARTAIRTGFICQNDLPQAYRELALILCMKGKLSKGKKAFAMSLQSAEKLGQSLQKAETLQQAHRVGHEVGWQHTTNYDELANRIITECQINSIATESFNEPELNLSLVDRFDKVLDSGRAIASSLIPESIYDHAKNAALHMLRGELCKILHVDRNSNIRWQDHSSDIVGRMSTHLAELAVENGSVMLSDTIEPSEQLNETSDRYPVSELFVPIHVRGKIESLLYVAHSGIRGLFGDEEARLAEFIATISGAALENSEGFAQLQELNTTLEQRVAERTAAAENRATELAISNRELEVTAQKLRNTQDELRAAKVLADDANEAKSKFLANMSHEIRTPMNGVLGMTELLLNTPLENQQRHYLNTVKQSGNALLTILNDILDLSKIEAGRMELESIPFSLRDVVLSAGRLLAVPAFGKGIELVCHVEQDVPDTLLGDPNRLRQIFVNLISNAVKFTEVGHVLLKVNLESTQESVCNLTCMVQDTGIGISKDRLSDIFEAFKQEDSSTTRKYGGTGLGLSITQQLTRLMGGEMHLESRVGEGSTFQLTLPMSRAEEVTSANNSKPLEDFTITVVSKTEVTSDAIVSHLYDTGSSVSNRVVLDKLPRGEWETTIRELDNQTLIFDIAAEQLANLEEVESLLLQLQTTSLPFVTLLPMGNVDVVELCRRLNVTNILMKPVDRQELIDALEGTRECINEIDSWTDDTPAQDSTQQLNILIADDSPVNQEVAKGMLELLGHKVKLADNGQEAFEKNCTEAFELILMDIEMPVLDGFAATERIRTHEQSSNTPQVPIYALSAHVSSELSEQCKMAGMNGYLSKPIDLGELLAATESISASLQKNHQLHSMDTVQIAENR